MLTGSTSITEQALDEPGGRARPSHWIVAAGAAGGPEMDWFRVAVFDEGRKSLGVTRLGRWIWTEGDDILSVAGDGAVGALPLLEGAPTEVAAKLARAAGVLGLDPVAFASSLPLISVIEAALQSGSPYWIERAVAWLEVVTECGVAREHLATTAADTALPPDLRDRLWQLAQSPENSAVTLRAAWAEASRKALTGSLTNLTCPACNASTLDGTWEAGTGGYEELHLSCRACRARNFNLSSPSPRQPKS